MRRLLSLLLYSLMLSLPSESSAQESAPSLRSSLEFFEWQLLDTETGRSMAFEDWLSSLRDQDVIYFGEEHHNRFHVMAAVKVLEALLVQGRRPAVALEMLSWDAQPALNRYLAGEISTADFLHEIRWDETWGGAFEDYAPLIDFGRQHHLPVLALNPPRALVRRVVAVGLAKALSELEPAGLGIGHPIPDDPRYAELITKQIKLCHPGMSAQGYQRMLEASLFRDEAMAKTIAGYLSDRKPDDGPLVSYTGSGHIQYQLPVPNRVLRWHAATRQRSVYLSSFEFKRTDEVNGLLQERIADYLWLTPLGAHGAPQRCG
jgi:uncharacterized iron-regulated protein